MPVYTLKPGHARTFLLGTARRPGEAVQIASPGALAPADREALAAHFKLAPGPAAPETPARGPALLANGLTEEQAREKLKGAGAPITDSLSGAPLASLFDAVFSAPGQNDAAKPDAASGETLTLAPEPAVPPAEEAPPAAPPKAARGKHP
jgi:hypothetical protein